MRIGEAVVAAMTAETFNESFLKACVIFNSSNRGECAKVSVRVQHSNDDGFSLNMLYTSKHAHMNMDAIPNDVLEWVLDARDHFARWLDGKEADPLIHVAESSPPY